MQTFFIVDLCTFSLLQQHERHRIFFGTFVKPKQGGVVRTLSLPSTVHGHNFRRQISVHKFPSTDNFRQHSYTHDTHSCSRCARMNELKTLSPPVASYRFYCLMPDDFTRQRETPGGERAKVCNFTFCNRITVIGYIRRSYVNLKGLSHGIFKLF